MTLGNQTLTQFFLQHNNTHWLPGAYLKMIKILDDHKGLTAYQQSKGEDYKKMGSAFY
jgi:hypothetical protein